MKKGLILLAIISSVLCLGNPSHKNVDSKICFYKMGTRDQCTRQFQTIAQIVDTSLQTVLKYKKQIQCKALIYNGEGHYVDSISFKEDYLNKLGSHYDFAEEVIKLVITIPSTLSDKKFNLKVVDEMNNLVLSTDMRFSKGFLSTEVSFKTRCLKVFTITIEHNSTTIKTFKFDPSCGGD